MGTSDDIRNALKKVTADWTRQKKAEEREPHMRSYRSYRLTREDRGIFIKEAAEEVMEEAYMAASANDTLPATARQVMYAARPKIQELTGRNLDDAYFTQTLLPDYIRDRTAAWLGARKWRLLHLIGGWYIWISFAVAVGKRVPIDRFYWPMAALVLAAAVVRLIAMAGRRRRRTGMAVTAP